MQIRLLGTAAGGGVPQWNCNCEICREARAGTGRVRPRTQSSVSLSADGQHWFLLNASPDIRAQIESAPKLQPAAGKLRSSPIEAVLLTDADLDHTLGLLLLREGEKLQVHAPANVQQSLTEGISVAPVLASFCGLEWIEPPARGSPLLRRDGGQSGLLYEAIPVRGRSPRFMKKRAVGDSGNVVGYRITDEKSRGRLLFLPEVAEMDEGLINLLAECEVVLFDGTFWSEHEMRERGAGNLPASAMGHVPISGAKGSLKVLADLEVKNRIYVHINNTNPILLEDSPERATVMAAGCTIGEDGMEFMI
jgi:pyrroloquinoline quinone biosynthesis protein B